MIARARPAAARVSGSISASEVSICPAAIASRPNALWPGTLDPARIQVSAGDGVNTLIAKARAELADAEFDLDQTTVRAAGSGIRDSAFPTARDVRTPNAVSARNDVRL